MLIFTFLLTESFSTFFMFKSRLFFPSRSWLHPGRGGSGLFRPTTVVNV